MSVARLPVRSRLVVSLSVAALGAGCGGASAAEPETSEQEYAEAMHEQHADETPEPTPAADPDEYGPGNVAGVETARVVYHGEVEGVHAQPASGSVTGVVLVHEWWGLNGNIVAVAEQLAAAGHQVLAVDIYGGESATDAEGAMALMTAALEDPTEMMSNVAGAVATLRRAGAERVAVMGFCFGGGVSLQTAMRMPDTVDASVVYYGRVPPDLSPVADVDDPMLLHFAVDDGGIPIAEARRLHEALQQSGVDAHYFEYEGVGHAFANPSGQSYDAAAAQAAWGRTLTFLNTQLRPGGE